MGKQFNDRSNQAQIVQDFQELLAEYRQSVSGITTRQEAAERDADTRIVATASQYTVDSIVKGLADLQLDFGKSTDTLVRKLTVEAPKLAELRRAIRVENRHAEELRKIRLAADALDILMQEHQETMLTFAQQSRQAREMLESEVASTRKAWRNEQEAFERAKQARLEHLKKERAQQEADYGYDLEQTRKVAGDEYAARKLALEHRIAEETARREADWSAREQVLQAQQETIERYRTLVSAYPSELEQAVAKARQEAFKTVLEEAEVQSQLFEKEHEANRSVSELQIAALKDAVAEHATQLDYLSKQLQTAVQQIQDLAAKAVSGKMEVSV